MFWQSPIKTMMIAEREKALVKQETVKEHNHKAKCEILEQKKRK